MSITMDTPGLLNRIQAKLIRPWPDCRLWPGAVDRGYGRVYVDGKAKRVHRVVWELERGPIPDGMTIDHLCRVRSCCNTAHMELVTQTENVERAKPFRGQIWRMSAPPRPSAPRNSDGLALTCSNGHEYTPENTGRWSTGARMCLTCRRLTKARARRAARQSVLEDTG